MKSGNHISNKERKLLLIVTFFTLVLACGSFFYGVIKNYNDFIFESQNELLRESSKQVGEVSFGVYATGIDARPLFRLLQILLFGLALLTLLRNERFLLSSLLIFTSFLIFANWFVDYYHSFSTNETKPENILEKLRLIAGYLDYLTFTFVSILLIWQFSILFRAFTKTQQNKNTLS